MPDLIPEISGAAIVLLGSFNPKIFQPEWFVRQGLLPQAEADACDVKIIAQQISHFETERFTILVTQERFIASSKPNSNPAPLRDVVQGAFFVLEHTPVTAMGLNAMMHFAMGSEQAWHRVGDRLAPKEGWSKVLPGRAGLMSMTVMAPKGAPDGPQLRVKVEPSQRVQHGVYFEVNEHFPAPASEPLKQLMATLAERWEGAQTDASRIASHILNWTADGDRGE